jgi:hypothetical protein
MKTTTAFTIISTAAWLGVTAAIIVTVVLTRRLSVLWFYLIPAIWGYHLKPRHDAKGGGTDD